MRRIRKVLFFKIIVICVSICVLADATGYTASNLRNSLMFDKESETVGSNQSLKRFLIALMVIVQLFLPSQNLKKGEFEQTAVHKKVSDLYFKRLSDLSLDLWQNINNTVTITTTDLGVEKFLTDAERYGKGTGLGVNLEFNFSIIARGNFDAYVFLDFNPIVTEVMLPVFLNIIAKSPTRRDFLSTVLSMNLTGNDVKRLFEGPVEYDDFPVYVRDEFGKIISRTSYEERLRRYEGNLKRILEKEILIYSRIQSHLTGNDEQALRRRQRMEEIFARFFHPGNLFKDQYPSMLLFLERNMEGSFATWLSSEKSYQKIRIMVLRGDIVGMTADLIDPTYPNRLSTWLQKNNKPPFSVFYPSNAGDWINRDAGPSGIRQMLDSFMRLPHHKEARLFTCTRFYGGQAMTINLDITHWINHYVNTNDSRVQTLLIDTIGFFSEEEFWQDYHIYVEALAPSLGTAYKLFLDRVKKNQKTISYMSIDEFLKWSQGITVQYNLPISVDTDHFRALVASLVYYKKIRTPEALQFERGETIELRRLPKYIDFSL